MLQLDAVFSLKNFLGGSGFGTKFGHLIVSYDKLHIILRKFASNRVIDQDNLPFGITLELRDLKITKLLLLIKQGFQTRIQGF